MGLSARRAAPDNGQVIPFRDHAYTPAASAIVWFVMESDTTSIH